MVPRVNANVKHRRDEARPVTWRAHCEGPDRIPLLSPSLSLAKPTALIVARDPMTGALLGSLVEVSGFQPLFPQASEEVATAIARDRPNIVLVDCDAGDEQRCVDSVADYGGATILFSPWRSQSEVGPIAERLGLSHFSLPISWLEFRRLLREAIGKSGH